MPNRITLVALLALVAAATPELFAQVRSGSRGRGVLNQPIYRPNTPGTRPGLEKEPRFAPRAAIEQKFPELRAVKRPLRLMPPRRRIVLEPALRADADLRRLADERRRLIGALRAARNVRDRRAMMTTMSRLESLRQQRMRRMRAIGKSERPARPESTTPEGPNGEPVIPLPTLPQPSRR